MGSRAARAVVSVACALLALAVPGAPASKPKHLSFTIV